MGPELARHFSIVAEKGDTNAFDKDRLEATAGRPLSLELQNPDAEPHNLSVYVSKGGESLFQGAFIDPGRTPPYDVPGLPAGDLYFSAYPPRDVRDLQGLGLGVSPGALHERSREPNDAPSPNPPVVGSPELSWAVCFRPSSGWGGGSRFTCSCWVPRASLFRADRSSFRAPWRWRLRPPGITFWRPWVCSTSGPPSLL